MDRTQHVLWRLKNGAIDSISPKLAILLIGTNNRENTPDDTAAGIAACLTELQQRLPETEIPPFGGFSLVVVESRVLAVFESML